MVNIAKNFNVKPGTILGIILGTLLALVFLRFGLLLLESVILILYPSIKSIEAIEGKGTKTPAKYKEP